MLAKNCRRDQPCAACRPFGTAPVDRSSGVSPDLYSEGALSNLRWDTDYLAGTFRGGFPVPLSKFWYSGGQWSTTALFHDVSNLKLTLTECELLKQSLN